MTEQKWQQRIQFYQKRLLELDMALNRDVNGAGNVRRKLLRSPPQSA
ncbi:hypothetical protein A2U01_0066392, partial [Trifolium medium]|nr:hypothetical protein [Trifolium medium]